MGSSSSIMMARGQEGSPDRQWGRRGLEKEQLKGKLTFRHVMGQLLGQFQPWTRLPPSHMCGWVLLGASLEEGVGQTYRLVVEVKGDRQGQKLKVWLECEGIVTAPVETRRGKEWDARSVFQLGQSELSSYQLVVEEGPGHDPGRGVVRLNDVVSQVHPVLVELHSGKASDKPRLLSTETSTMVQQELREAAIAHSVAGHPASFFSPQYGNKVLVLRCSKLGQSAKLYVSQGVPDQR